jgi:hypothetical protein
MSDVTLEDQTEEDADMVSLSKRHTGIANTLFASTKGYVSERHGPRLKIAIDPPGRFIAGGKSSVMTIPDYRIAGEPIPSALAEQVRRFIDVNHEALMTYWNGDIDTADFIARIRRID